MSLHTFSRWCGRTMAIVVCALSACSCISIEFTETGIEEESNVDSAEMIKHVLALADERSAERERREEILASDHPQAVSTRSLLERALATQKPTASIGGDFPSRHDAVEYFDRSKVRLVILVRDVPLAEAYPNGTIYVTAGLVDPSLPDGAQNEAQLVGVLAHETVHLSSGHVLRQWVAIEARQREMGKKALAALTTVLPVVSFEYNPGASYTGIEHYDQYAEFEADHSAAEILRTLSYEPGEYLAFLTRLRASATAHPAAEPYGWIEGRVACLGQFLLPTEARLCVVERSGPDGQTEEKLLLLSPDEQSALCVGAQVHLSGPDQATFVGWLAAPANRRLNDIAVHLSRCARERVGEWIGTIALGRYGPFALALGSVGLCEPGRQP